MPEQFSMPALGKALIYGGIVALVTVESLTIATPCQAFWFFHKNKKQEEQIGQPSSYAGGYSTTRQSTVYMPPAYVPQKTRQHARRLVPAYMYKNMPATAPGIARDNNPAPVKSANREGVAVSKNINGEPATLPLESTVSSLVPSNRLIRVGIGLNLEKAKISIIDGAQIIDNNNGQVIADLSGQSQWIISEKEDQIVFQPRTEYYNAIAKLALAHDSAAPTGIEPAAYYPSSVSSDTTNPSEDLSILPASNLPPNMSNLTLPLVDGKFNYVIKAVAQNGKDEAGLLALNDRPYRGDFLIQSSKEKFNIINTLNLEDYLLGVVPSEMPSLWPEEALKAQAIAARSYATANLGKHGSDGYDVKDNTEDQMYLGVKAETEPTNKAVIATNGLMIKYDDKPICAYFHSGGGGSTEAAENVWRKALPYLKAVIDFDQDSPMYNWTKNFTADQAHDAMPADKDLGKILSICVSERSPSGRAVRLVVFGSKNACIISAEAARKYFSLPSTNFNVTPLENAYVFVGKGFGHGLGLSQWGARALANHGYNAAQILCYYYNGISIGY